MAFSKLLQPAGHVRYHRDNNFWRGKKLKFTIIIGFILLLLQLLFLGNMAYLLGAIFRAEERTNHINLLVVDYDGGLMGQAVKAAYSQLEGKSFPTLQFTDGKTFSAREELLVSEVCYDIDIWGAIYIHENASERLIAALAGGSSADTYNSSNTMTYIVNEARYTLSVAVGIVSLGASTLASATSVALATMLATDSGVTLNTTSPTAIAALATPITLTSIIIAHTPQAARALYNTAIIVLTIIPNMFFIMALNQNQLDWSMFSRATLRANISFRLMTSVLYALATAACATGYIWAFKEDWVVTATQGVLTWLEFTLYCHIQFLVIDICTAFLPMSGVPFIILFWIISNVASAIYPFELSPGFYKWGYALPAHHHYQNLVTIWSHGCAPQLYRTLPILFTWWVVGLVVGVMGMTKRCVDAAKADEDMESSGNGGEEARMIRLDTYRTPLPFRDALNLRPARSASF